MQEQHFKKLENMYHAAPFQELIKSKLKISEGEAELEMVIDPILHHAANAIHGFVYFKMMDDVAIFAANSMEKEFFLPKGIYLPRLNGGAFFGSFNLSCSLAHLRTVFD